MQALEQSASSAAGSADDPAGDGPADVGVLLVHGIGDHGEADTLLAFGEPLLDWLREWLAGPRQGRPRGKLVVSSARLRAQRDEGESPACASLEIHDDTGAGERWLMAESWWGDSVKVPGSLALLGWMFTRLPLLVLWHLFGGDPARGAHPIEPQRAPRLTWNAPVPEWLTRCAKALLAPLLILTMQSLVAVAAVLSLVPFGPWRQAVLAALRVLTLTLGDSYVLLEQDIQRAALAARVRRSLAWLRKRASRIVVIAHSQGGAIAHDALQAAGPVDCFISVGSGLEKLEFLRLVRERRAGLFAASMAAPALALGLAGLLSGWLGWVERGVGWWVGPVALLLVAWLAIDRLVRCLAPYREALRAALARSALLQEGWSGRWCDVYATLDLVPMGRASMLPARAQLQRVELRNECSLIADHVRYFESRNGFAAWCWGELARCSRLRLLVGDEWQQLAAVGRWHARRAFGLGFGGGLLPLTLVFGTLLFSEAMGQLGGAVLQALSGAELGWTRRALQWLMQGAARLVGLLPGLDNTPAQVQLRGQVFVVVVIAALALALWSVAVVALWRTDNRGRWRAVCRGDSTLLGPAAVWFGSAMALFWCLLAMLPLLAALLVSRSPDVLSFGALGRAMAAIVSVLLLLMATVGMAAAAFVRGDELADSVMDRRLRPLWPLFAAAGAGFWIVLASEAWRIGTGARYPGGLLLMLGVLAGLLWAISVTWHQRLRATAMLGLWTVPLAAAAIYIWLGGEAATAGWLASGLMLLGVGWLRERSRPATPG